jgi:2-methylcitrate dehydratase PrpD
MAMIALDGTAFVDQYREERLRDPAVLDLIARIRAHVDAEIEAMGAAFRHGARVNVTTRDGRSFKTELLNRRGSAENPLQPEDIDYKFRQVVKSCLPPAQIERVVSLVRDMDKLPDICELIGIMAAASAR